MPLHRALLPLATALALAACDGSNVVGPRDGAARDAAVDADDADDAASDLPDASDAPLDRADASDAADVTDVIDAPDATDATTDIFLADVLPPDDVPFDRPVDVGRDIALVDVPVTGPVLPRPGRSGAVAITFDDRIAVSANRRADSVSVYALSTGVSPALSRLAEIPTGANSEPWQVEVAADGDSAFVLLRRTQQVARIARLHSGVPVLQAVRASTGSEPTSMALSPSGRTLYVGNWADGTVTVINTETMAIAGAIDLNEPLAAGGFLGTGVAPRRALAHPRALAMTNNGDGNDDDETLFVTEFFAMRRTTGVPAGLERFDQNQQGVVYRVPLATRVAAVSTLAPAADMGFRAGDNSAAGCFPNQLYAAAIAQGRVFVTGVCASPRGPVGAAAPPTADGGVDAGADAAVDVARDVSVDASDAPDAPPPIPPLDPAGANFRTELTGAIFVLDATTGAELIGSRVLLNKRFHDLYDARRTPDDAQRRMPLLPVDLDFVPASTGGTATSSVLYVAAAGADALFRVTFTPAGALASVGTTAGSAFVDLGAVSAPVAAGSGPYGVAISAASNNALAVNEFTRNVSAVELTGQGVTGSAEVSAATLTGAPASVLRGRRFFATGLGRWSFKGQAWNSCESCHPDGLTDNVTWYFARGPRQTLPLDATLDAAGTPRLLNWTAVFDELADFELNVRGNSGGVGAVVHRRNDGATPPAVTSADRIVFDGTAPASPQVATPEPDDGLSGAIDGVATSAGTNRVHGVLDDWADLQAYVTTIRTPRSPRGLDTADVGAGRALFVTHNCAGCHGGPEWTISQRFYVPGAATTDRAAGSLVRSTWTRPANFPTSVVAAAGTFRLSPFDAANDQILCALRNVGTWSSNAGVTPAGVDVLEVRTNMTTTSQGATGFNPPSLLGVAHDAPYLHAGNARTLEELFLDVFGAHHRAYSPNFLATPATRATELRQLVAFLLSIDAEGTTAPVPIPARVTPPGGTAFDAVTCAQFR